MKNKRTSVLSPTNLYDEARKRLSELKRVEEEKRQALLRSPEGKIHIVSTASKGIQYYLRTETNDKSGKYIKKGDKQKIIRYLQKAYDEKVYRMIQTEIKSIEALLKHSEDYNIKIRKVYSDSPEEVKELIYPIDCMDTDYARKWKELDYKANPIPIQDTEYNTDNGECVRSKSEMNIANALFKYGAIYLYEAPVTLKNGKTVYPDFTIINVKQRKVIYWEHRGMMDDREYAKNAVRKVKDYMKNGIIPGDNLILTEETQSSPLGTDEINSIIQTFLI